MTVKETLFETSDFITTRQADFPCSEGNNWTKTNNVVPF